ncbi:hypothetical protein ACFE04_021159 [Oxalis oulophora]
MSIQQSDLSAAEKFKLQANEAFKAHKYAQAIDLYSQAIEIDSENAIYYANRSFAHAKLEEYGSAVQDATTAIQIDPNYSKGYYRRGAAYLAMAKFKEALKDFQQVKKICPNDPDATKKLKECEKAVMKLKFEEAISAPVSNKPSVAESIDFRTIDLYQSLYLQTCVPSVKFLTLYTKATHGGHIVVGSKLVLMKSNDMCMYTVHISLSRFLEFDGREECQLIIWAHPSGLSSCRSGNGSSVNDGAGIGSTDNSDGIIVGDPRGMLVGQ